MSMKFAENKIKEEEMKFYLNIPEALGGMHFLGLN
jgi:hypothetical protein